MIQGQIVELTLKDGDHVVGYYQHTENRTIFLSPYTHGNYTFGVSKNDIKSTVCLEYSSSR